MAILQSQPTCWLDLRHLACYARRTVANVGFGRKGKIDMNKPLDRAAIIAGLEDRQGWQLTPEDASSQVIEKKYFFKDFNAAFGFMGRVALMAERANHHPEFNNQYRQVTICWATHSCGGITALDLEMAKICDQLAVDSGLKA